MPVIFEVTDAGRSTSRRVRQRNDCTVRAVATAFGFEYDTAYDLLAHYGRVSGRGTLTYRNWLDKQLTVRKDTFSGTLHQFYDTHQTGTWLVVIHRHITCIIDGVLYDDHLFLYELNSKVEEVWECNLKADRLVAATSTKPVRKLKFTQPK